MSQEELDDALRFANSELLVGYGKDGTWLRHRRISDPYPMKITASLAIANSEEIFPLLLEGIAREKEVDILGGGSLLHVFGREIRSGTPFETLAGYQHARMHVEARRKAGRPGMGGINIYSAVTEFGQFGGYGIPGGAPVTDLALVLFPSEMKVDYRTFNKVVRALNVGGMIKAASYGMIGGMAGPPEGAVVSSIANGLLTYPILQNHAGGGHIYDVRYLANVNREGLWALSVAQQALSRNTHIITDPTTNQVSGAGTDKLLYEIAASIATAACSGTSMSTSPRTAGGKLTDYVTPLECRFSAEVAHSASALAPAEVNGIVKELLPRYEATLKQPDLGKRFQDLYDLDTLEPNEEWEAIYRRVKREVTELGIPLQN